MVLGVKNLPANAGDLRDAGSIPGLGRSPGGGSGSPLWYSLLENPMDRGAWRVTVHRLAKSRTQLKRLSTHVRMGERWRNLMGNRNNKKKNPSAYGVSVCASEIPAHILDVASVA